MDIEQSVLDDLRKEFGPLILKRLRLKGIKVPPGAVPDITVRDPAKVDVTKVPAWEFFGEGNLNKMGCGVFSCTLSHGVHSLIRSFANGSSHALTTLEVCEDVRFSAFGLSRHGLEQVHIAKLREVLVEYSLPPLKE